MSQQQRNMSNMFQNCTNSRSDPFGPILGFALLLQ
jgi:hypothetical protein